MDFAALIISVVALVISIMTLPTAFQMICGKPKIRVKFEKTILNEMTLLRSYLWNEPVKNRFIRSLGVTREPVEVSASISVEKSTGELVTPLVIATISTEKESGKQVTLYHHAIPARVTIVVIKQDTAFLLAEECTDQRLDPGGFVITLDFILSNGTTLQYKENLVSAIQPRIAIGEVRINMRTKTKELHAKLARMPAVIARGHSGSSSRRPFLPPFSNWGSALGVAAT
jgi:hypothetical protein